MGGVTALDGLTLELRRGEVLGLLGPNGAGKTTAMELALGFLRASAGRGWLLGKPFGDAAARARVGYAPDAPVFFAGSAVEALAFAARLNGVRPDRRRLESVLEMVGLRDGRRGAGRGAQDVRKFSRGMQQRLGLAQALVGDPEVLILDEPASALDPLGVAEVRELLRRLRAEGKSILFSSHQLTEVEQVCDRVAFLHAGRLLHCGPLRELLEVPGRVEVVVRGLPAGLPVRARLGESELEANAGLTRWVLPAGQEQRVIEEAWAAGAELVSVRPAGRSLPEVFAGWMAGSDAGT